MHEPHGRDCESRADSHDAPILVLVTNNNPVEWAQRPCIQVQAPIQQKIQLSPDHQADEHIVNVLAACIKPCTKYQSSMQPTSWQQSVELQERLAGQIAYQIQPAAHMHDYLINHHSVMQTAAAQGRPRCAFL